MYYLSGVRNEHTDRVCSLTCDHNSELGLPLGLMITPLTQDYINYAHIYPAAALDHGTWQRPHLFTPSFYHNVYAPLIQRALARFGDYLLFATAPDVWSDWPATIARAVPVLRAIRNLGAIAAIVGQDGATPADIPWDEIDALFLGGTTPWKIGPSAEALCREAVRRHKWVHMGKVNDLKRMRIARDMGCDSCDGTRLLYSRICPRCGATYWKETHCTRDGTVLTQLTDDEVFMAITEPLRTLWREAEEKKRPYWVHSVALIGCGKEKRQGTWPAGQLYSGSLFRATLAHALRHYDRDNVFILSAKYGIVGLDEPIASYDRRIDDLSNDLLFRWGTYVVGKLEDWIKRNCEPGSPLNITIYAGSAYVRALTEHPDFEAHVHGKTPLYQWRWRNPLKGMRIDSRLAWLAQH